MERQLQVAEGSLQDYSSKQGMSLEMAWLEVEAVILVDTSSSMYTTDVSEQTRYDRAIEEMKKLQKSMPGKVAIIGFSSEATVATGGVPYFQAGSTNMVKALQAVHGMDGLAKIILISDGYPDNPDTTLEEASRFKCPIETIYIGPGEDAGYLFLKKLSQATGGRASLACNAEQLMATTMLLLESGNVSR